MKHRQALWLTEFNHKDAYWIAEKNGRIENSVSLVSQTNIISLGHLTR